MQLEYSPNKSKQPSKIQYTNTNDIFAHLQINIPKKMINIQGQMVNSKIIADLNLAQILKLQKANPALRIPKDAEEYVNIFEEYAKFDVHFQKQASRIFFQKHYNFIYLRFLQSYFSMKQSELRQIDETKTLIDWMDWLQNNVIFKNPNIIKKPNPKLQIKNQTPVISRLPSRQDLQKQYRQTMTRAKQKIQLKKQKVVKKVLKKGQSKQKSQQKKTQLKQKQQNKSRQKKKEQSSQKRKVQSNRGRSKKKTFQISNVQFDDQMSSLSFRSSEIQKLRLDSSCQKDQKGQDMKQKTFLRIAQKSKQQDDQLQNTQQLKQPMLISINTQSKSQLNKSIQSLVQVQKQKEIQVIQISQGQAETCQQLKSSQQSLKQVVNAKPETNRLNRFKRQETQENNLSRGRLLLSTTPPFNLKHKRKSSDLDWSFQIQRQYEQSSSSQDNGLKIKYSTQMFNTMKRLAACLANQQLRYYIMPQMVKYRNK